MILYILLIFIIVVIAFLNFAPVFGSKSEGESKLRIENSPNFNDGKFQNIVPTKMSFSKNDSSKSDFLTKYSNSKYPEYPLPNLKFDKTNFEENYNNTVTWFGHSTILLKLEQKSILIDPVFNRASPFSVLLGPKPFAYENPITADDLPEKINILLITHNHYDHLDYKTIQKIHPNVENILVPLGDKAHLIKWGVPHGKISEFDWYDSQLVADTEFIFTPSRHFSGRALGDRFKTLWGGWIIKSKSNSLFISGDGGYSDEFKKIGDKYGPFDLIFIENGAYNPRWHNLHLFPEQSVQASFDANAKLALPIHWAKFNLSYHNWTDPIERFTKETEKKNLKYTTPIIGQTFILEEEVPNEKWWEYLQ